MLHTYTHNICYMYMLHTHTHHIHYMYMLHTYTHNYATHIFTPQQVSTCTTCMRP
jgi:hypothetical protein